MVVKKLSTSVYLAWSWNSETSVAYDKKDYLLEKRNTTTTGMYLFYKVI